MTGRRDASSKALLSNCGTKVHHLMCKELKKLVDRISQILPTIESAQPRCSLGIDALCSLNLTLDKAKLLIQHCTESSKLYLVITGDTIKLRCERIRNACGQSLSQIQSMVPLLLAAQIGLCSRMNHNQSKYCTIERCKPSTESSCHCGMSDISAIVDDLKDVKFIMEASDEEAGKVVLHLLRHASNSAEDSEFKEFLTAALGLQLTSSKALLIEKRSIRKLLDKVCDTDQTKERILRYLLYLVERYGQSVGGQTLNCKSKEEDPAMYSVSSHDKSTSKQSTEPGRNAGSVVYEIQGDPSCKPEPPDEFTCPISLKLINDPVVIASGITFERVLIEKWFKEGHNTCPKTQEKLSHLSVIPNSAMKDLISKWCSKHGISISDPSSQPIPAEIYEWKISPSTSIASIRSSFLDTSVQIDDNSVSFDSRCVGLVTSQMSIDCLVSHQTVNNCDKYQSPLKFSNEVECNTLPELSKLPWESQCRVVEDVRNTLNENEQACNSIICSSSVQAISRFLKDAFDRSDVKAQRVGAQVFRIFVTKSRNEDPSLYEDVFYLVVSFLDSEIVEEALAIIEAISGNQYCKLEVVTSRALVSILRILESQNRDVQVFAARILANLSSQSSVGIQIVHSGYIPKLISLLCDRALAPHCISILKNLCFTKEGRLAVGESNKSIASIVEILETGNREEQEQGVTIFLSLCSHCIEYCQVLLKEGAIPSLVTISINGNANGKAIAMELLHILRDTKWNDSQSSFPSTESIPELPRVSAQCSNEKQSVSKGPGYFRRKINLFSKPRSLPLC